MRIAVRNPNVITANGRARCGVQELELAPKHAGNWGRTSTELHPEPKDGGSGHPLPLRAKCFRKGFRKSPGKAMGSPRSGLDKAR